MRGLWIFWVLASLCVGLIVDAQTTPGKATQPAKQEKPSPLTPEQQELNRLNEESIAAYQKGDYPSTERVAQMGLEKAQALKDETWTAQFLNILGLLNYSQGQFNKAIDFHTRALAIREKIGKPQNIAASLNNLGVVYYNLGEFNEALKFHSRALVQFEQYGNPLYIAQSLNNVGNVYLMLGQYEKALDYLNRSFTIKNKLGTPEDIAYSLTSLGVIYQDMGQFDKALDFHNRALLLFDQLGNPQNLAHSLNNIGNLYTTLGQFSKALSFHKRALALRENLGNLQDIASSLDNIANAYDGLQQFDKALDFHSRGLTIREKVGNLQEIAVSLANMGRTSDSLNQFDKARGYYNRALTIDEKLGNEKDISICLTNLGSIYSHQKRFPQVLNCLTRALAIQKKLGNTQRIAAIINDLGDIYDKKRQFKKAERAFLQAITLYEGLLTQVSDASHMGTLEEAEQGNPYLRFAVFLFQRRQTARALSLLERSRGQGLARQALQNHVDPSVLLTNTDASLRQQKQTEVISASALWQAVQNRLLPSDKVEQQKLIEQQRLAEQRYRKAETDATAFEASLRLRYPRYRLVQGFASPSAVQLATLAQKHPDTLFVEFAIVDDTSSLLFALSSYGLKAFSLPVGKKVLQNLAENWKRELVSHSSKESGMAKQLGNMVLSPLDKAGLLQENKFSHLVVVADGPLLDIPFAALVDSRGKRLVERFAVSSAFSLGSLLWLQEPQQPIGTLLCVADPTGDGSKAISLASRGGFEALPAARHEVEQLVPLFPGSKMALYFGRSAQRERIQNQMSQYALLHFATHGVVDGVIGLRSGLLLADDKAEEKYSILEAREIASMRLTAQMAVLSACSTAEGQKSGGDGLLGLAWAFRAAGCLSIVASQWEVNDAATGQLMHAFYKALKSGKRKDDALRQAMLTVRKQKPSPYYWAAFQAMGDTQPLHVNSEKSATSKR